MRRDGTLTRVNSTLERWTGQDRAALLEGETFSSLLTVASQLYYETSCVPLLLAGRPVNQVALDLRRSDGTTTPVLFAASVHARDDTGAIATIRGSLVDISRRKVFERDLVDRNDALMRSNEEYDTFAHAVAHDLRAPIRGIGLTAEFLHDDAGGLLPPDCLEQLRTIIRLAGRMTEMLDGLLAYTQLAPAEHRPEPVWLPEALGEVMELLGTPARGARIRCVEARFTVDPAALQQLLLNLVSNAIKYSSGDAEIAIGTATLGEVSSRSTPPPTLSGKPDDTPVLTVADRGRGIDPAHQRRVFGLFHQLDPSVDGSGTGLALCQLICRRAGGDIWLTSTPGVGTTCFVVPTA